MQHLDWQRLDDLRGNPQYRATNGPLVARTLITVEDEHRCMVLDGSDESFPIVHDQFHGTLAAAQTDAALFMEGWNRLHTTR